jgi:hypothetical protein
MKIMPKSGNVVIIETNKGKAFEILEDFDGSKLIIREVDPITHNLKVR